ncbi:thymidylate kinase isoform X2 [Harpegnathos saltator]|uniref:thymidylate kinase isoform X2 n=1 Tax=Harpegnathos saltator TaxID=610380 RepID=UPI00058D83D2|nr:thymidylate kinase isoform X2 [Harpegnathos saltator]
MCSKRGALIVLEGCDRAGKSTQVKLLTNALNERSIPTKASAFPNRNTPIGGLLNGFLSKEINIPPEAAHLLFSANRWECKEDIEKMLLSGTTLVIDRCRNISKSCAITGDDTWMTVDADQNVLTIHGEILKKALSVIQEVQFRRIELLNS